MSLKICKLATECHVPQQLRKDAEIVDQLARGRFARDLGTHLGPSLARQPAIIRIRRLPVRVIIPASELNEDALSLHWRQELGKALFTALAYPAGEGPLEIFQANSVAGFVASAVLDLLDGTAPAKWQYAEFESFFRLGSTQAALALICEWPRQSLAVLIGLAEQHMLGRLLARFDDLAIERAFGILAPSPENGTLSVTNLIAAARLVLDHPPEKASALRSRAYALTLFVEAQRVQRPQPSPRALFHALLSLAALLNEELFWPGNPSDQTRAAHLPSNVSAILESIGGALREHMQSTFFSNAGEPVHLPFGLKTPGGQQTRGERISSQLEELSQLLHVLRVELKVLPPSISPEVRWVSSEWCGLFFLASTLQRLGWIPAWRQLADFQVGGVACLAAGLALTIVGRFDPAVPSLDPGIVLFGGYLGDPDIAHLRKVFQEFPRQVQQEVLHAALPHELANDAAENWEGTFKLLAVTLIREFASRIRGFRQATQQGIVRSFIVRQGRIRIEPERLVVFPAPSPFNVALHISGMDEPVDSSLWLGGRRIEFQLGDL
jgi:hypothetical protein